MDNRFHRKGEKEKHVFRRESEKMKMSKKKWAVSLKAWEENLASRYGCGNHQRPGDTES